jgi:hypothetical protein
MIRREEVAGHPPSSLCVWRPCACSQHVESKLSRFMGRPYDLSPKARLKALFG